MNAAYGRPWLLAALLAVSTTFPACENVESSLGVDWNAFDSAEPPIVPRAFAIQEGDLIAIGQGSSRPIHDVLAWDRNRWEIRGDGLHVNEPRAVALFEDQLVLGGEADLAAGDSMAIAVERESVWSSLGEVDGSVSALAVLGSALVVGGSFEHVGTDSITNLARWSGSAWSALGGGVDGPVGALHVESDSLLVIGDFTMAGGIDVGGVALYRGGVWSSLGERPAGAVTAVGSWQGRPVLGGSFETMPGRRGETVSVIVREGSAWEPLGALDLPEGITALVVYEDALYAAGRPGAFVWTGSTWRQIHSAQGGTVAMIVYRENLVFGDGAGVGSSVSRCRTCPTR